MINKLQINNFRNYKNLRFAIPEDSRIVVLYGANGEGKTNILEGISLLFASNGLRKAKYEDMINKSSGQKYWSIIAETESGEFTSGYSLGDKSGKRIYKVNEKSVRNLDEFRKDNYILWMTYETDRLFMQSPSDRRDFIDMFCNVRSKIHAQNLRDYEKLTRERLKILKRFCETGINQDTAKWLDVIENKIVDLGIKIATERNLLASELEEHQIRNGEFPIFKTKMSGRLEDEVLSQEDSHDRYRTELVNRRQKDGIVSSTTLGPNRSDWIVFHEGKQINAEHCSAGEQKLLLLGIFFSFIVQNIKSDSRNLIILLDDVVAHLDSNHRDLFFKYVKSFVINSQNISAWLSGTNKDLFDELSNSALFYKISNGGVF